MKRSIVIVITGLLVAWGPYGFFSYWWYRLGMDTGFRGEVYGPVSYFRPRSFVWGLIATVIFLIIGIAFTARQRRD